MSNENSDNGRLGINRRTVLQGMAAASGAGLLGTSAVGTVAASEQVGVCEPACEIEVPLCAGQEIEVGTVYVRRVPGEDQIEVEYVLDGDTENAWYLRETHLYVGKTDPTELSSAPGQFPFSKEDYSDGVTEDTYTIGFGDICEYEVRRGNKWEEGTNWGVEEEDCVWIAAHAVVDEVLEEAPYFAANVVTADQGVKKNLDPIADERSNPVAALEQEYPDSPREDIGFFSLGFNYDEENEVFEDEGGSIEVEFDCPVHNGEGDDLRIWEVTFSPYPLESADVYAWDDDNEAWVFLGSADNTEQGPEGSPDALTVSDFDLGVAGLDSTSRVKIVDTTDPDPHNGNADGFDLDGIQALQDCTEDETAWGDGCEGSEITEGGNWATYFQYGIGTCEETLPECPMYGTSRVGSEEDEVEIWSVRYDSDTDSIIEEVVGDIPDNSSNENYPNGLAFDPEKQIWYFTEEDGILKTMNEDGCLGIEVYNGGSSITGGNSIAGATLYAGGYYFTPQGGDTLWRVDLNPDGSVNEDIDGNVILDDDVRNLPVGNNTFGDIAADDDGILYFSVNGAFFKVDLNDGSNDGIIVQSSDRETYAVLSQLAFDDSGILWAHHAGTGDWRTANLDNGTLSDVVDTTKTYTDLATCGTYELDCD